MSDLGRALRFLLRNPTKTEPAAEESEDPHEIRASLFWEISAGTQTANSCVDQATLIRPSCVSAVTPSSRPISWVILPF
jgi:hypothetical protein